MPSTSSIWSRNSCSWGQSVKVCAHKDRSGTAQEHAKQIKQGTVSATAARSLQGSAEMALISGQSTDHYPAAGLVQDAFQKPAGQVESGHKLFALSWVGSDRVWSGLVWSGQDDFQHHGSGRVNDPTHEKPGKMSAATA